MEKLTNRQLCGIAKLVHYIHDEKAIQCILEALGKENWTRDILGNSHYLTEEQNKIFWSMGGDYTSEEIDEELDKDSINYLIAQELEKNGLTGFSDDIFENQEYLDKIREGKIICESIDVEEIKRRYMNNEV